MNTSETMDTKRMYKNHIMAKDCEVAKTAVFWDVEDYPIPNDHLDLEPDSVCEKIKSTLSFRGEMSILAYMDEQTCPDRYRDAGITLHVPGGKSARFNKTIVDILVWALDNPAESDDPKNVVVISKNMSIERQFNEVLASLQVLYYNVVCVLPDDFESQEWSVPDANFFWLWESLLEGGMPIDRSITDPLLNRQPVPHSFFCVDDTVTRFEDITCSICDILKMWKN